MSPTATTATELVEAAHAMIESGYGPETPQFWAEVYPLVEALAMTWARRYHAIPALDEVVGGICELLVTRCDWTQQRTQVVVWVSTVSRRVVLHAIRTATRSERREMAWGTAHVHNAIKQAGVDPTGDSVLERIETRHIQDVRQSLRVQGEWLAVAFDDLLDGMSWPKVCARAQPFSGIKDPRTLRRVMRQAVSQAHEQLGVTHGGSSQEERAL